MSANNEVVILKEKGVFEVHENPCVDNEFEPSKNTILFRFSTLIEAIKKAKEYCNEYPYVEYGFTIWDSALEDSQNVGSEEE